MRKIFKYAVLLIYGGVIYYFIELIYRGYSHYAMILVGGLCFICIGLLNELYTYKIPLIKQMFISSFIVTVIEFIAGVVLNMWLKLDIWDYSTLRFNILGQISLQTSVVWFFLALPAIYLDDYLRYWMFGEAKPQYKLI
ncbi:MULTISPECIES: putative ABC transporter permease [unclassified Sedimentibacter]|uniref:putative ABC transporter permease n=1 Tax=unclassified Sedimentibacter TaxID=2649220 RepID=UPI0027E213CD|nr:hypothetical protein [Sedimentibacter sp. MB35-C1]WMJ78517.1 hypothetical protein RBQ61_06235 [Sedimentibacter sp. MB35-C1]